MNTQSLINRINTLIDEMEIIFSNSADDKLAMKPAPGKWSAKEILGHLADSASNNLRRFNEATFREKPYKVVSYDQDALVAANNYQQVPPINIFNLWKSLNTQIIHVISIQNEKTLNYKIVTPDSKEQTLFWLIEDYVIHLLHHVDQIRRRME